jgi:hypothetical protein
MIFFQNIAGVDTVSVACAELEKFLVCAAQNSIHFGGMGHSQPMPHLVDNTVSMVEPAASPGIVRCAADCVAKVPKRCAAKFPLNDITSGNRRSMLPQARHRSRR